MMLRVGLVVCLVAVCAGGCSIRRPGNQTVLTVAVRGGPADVQAAEDLRASFEREHPRIKVRLEHIPDKQYYAKLLTMLAGNSGPDVFGLTNGTILPHVAKGTLLDVAPLMKRDGGLDKADFFPKALAAYRFGDKLYGMPNNFHAFALYYNKTLFDKAGVPYPNADWDWDDLLSAARKLTRDNDGDGRIDQYGIVFDSWLGAVAPWIWQNGGSIFDNESDPKRCTLDSPECVEALQFLADLKLKYKVAPGASETAEQGVVEMFYAGRAAMYPYLYVAGRMRQYAKGFEWDCAPLPRGRTGIRASWAGSGCYCINRRTRVPEAAWEYVKHATGPRGMRLDAKNGIAIPARRSVAYSEAFMQPQSPPANKQVFLDAFGYARLNPSMIRVLDFLTVFQEQTDRLFLGDADARTVAGEITRRVNEELGAAGRGEGKPSALLLPRPLRERVGVGLPFSLSPCGRGLG